MFNRQCSLFAFRLRRDGVRQFSSPSSLPTYSTLLVKEPFENVIEVQINRPGMQNAMNQSFFNELKNVFNFISLSNYRSVLLTSSGRNFSSGLDMKEHAKLFQALTLGSSSMEKKEGVDSSVQFLSHADVARKSFFLKSMIETYQDSLSSISSCSIPVIALVKGACIGGGIDLLCNTDIRFSTNCATFSIREVDIGIAADIGTLQRIEKIVKSSSFVREMAYTGRDFCANEAHQCGLVSRVFNDEHQMYEAGLAVAKLIAKKSPVAIRGTKTNLNYAANHSIEDSLKFQTLWSMSMLQTSDILASTTEKNPSFEPVMPVDPV
jgi:Delta3,5-Delta2,4-dienoyl-CoA isomerase